MMYQKTILLLLLGLLTGQLIAQRPLPQNQVKKMKQKSMMLGLRTTIYQVGDLQAAKTWYANAFGVQPYFDQPYYVGFNIAGYELGLQPTESPAVEKAASVVAYWGVEEIQEVYDRLIQLGATEHEPPTNVGGELMTATVKDPFGNLIGLIYNPNFVIESSPD